ncbi:MAG: metal ABC transporter substrate-binding protein, partial [Puniceicoccales bacterium]
EPGEAYWNDIPALHPNAASEPPCCREDALAENEIWSAMAAMMPESHHDHHHEHCHDHGVDPHVWLDPQLALQMVLAINTALNEAAPEYTTYFNRRRETYLEALLEVDHWAKEQLALIPVERRILINHHDNLRYFGRRYGYFTPASILGSATTETADPSARQFTELIALIQAQDAPAIFIDATANPRLAEQLAREAGLPKPSILYTGNLTPADGPAPDYLSMMRANVGTITTALR